MISTFEDVDVKGRVTQRQRAVDDEHLVTLAHARELLGETFQGTWDSGTTYTKGQSVSEGGSFYIANVGSTNKQPSLNETEWRLAASKGAGSYTYVRYATDASGTGFSSSPSGKTYVAFLTTTTVIASPVVGDFSGLWVKFVGDAGSAGATGATGAAGAAGASVYLYIGYASDASGTGFSLTPGSGLNYVAFKKSATEIVSPVVGDFAGLWKLFAVAALSATAPITYNAGSGVIACNAASANTASYLVQRDSNGDFAARKVTLNTATGTDHLTFGTAATMGYSGGNVVFNKPVSATKIIIGSTHELRPGSGKTEFYSVADAANAVEVTGLVFKVMTTLQVASLNGVLKASSGTVAGSATTDDLTEGATNLYFTNTRADTRADLRIAAVAGQANGLAQLGSDGKLATAQIPSALLGATIYQGTWNANTNSPALASGTGTKGHYYIVSTAGTTNLDGVASWAIGDWVIFNGTDWEKVDNTDAVLSVNGYLGAVTLVTDDIAEDGSPTNLWFTTARVLATTLSGLSATTGSITSSDTILSALNKTQGRLAAIEAWDTDDLTEGSTRLYYTEARVKTLAATGLNSVVIAPAASTSGSPNLLTVTGPAHTTLANGAEAADVYLNLNRIVQFATGALTTQRAVRITAPSYAFVAASTLTDASTVEISGAPKAWSNATVTNAYGLRIAAGALAADNTNGYGLYVQAPTGATNNYAASFTGGNVGIGTTAPTKILDINGDTLRLRTARTPASATATGSAGEVCWDTGYVYVCTATDTWKRAALTTW